MKAISVRFNTRLGNWLKSQSKEQGVQLTEYVRDLITVQMKEPHFFEYFKAIENQTFAATAEHKHLIYNLMVYKLVEQLVLNQEGGQQQREAAYAATLEWLTRLRVYPIKQKSYRLSLLLHSEQLVWLSQQSQALNKNMTTIIRKIVFLAYSKAVEKAPSLVNRTELTEARQEELKAILMTFTLLKSYIENVYEEGETLVKNCCESAQTLYKKMASS